MEQDSQFSHLYELLKKRKEDNKFRSTLEHREFCECEDCIKKLDEYNKRNNTTYQIDLIW